MGHKICAWACWAILLLAPLRLCPAAQANPAVLAVRLGLHPGSTRIVLEISESAAYRVGLLAEPARLYVELPESDWSGLRLPAGLGQVAKVAMTTSGGITRVLKPVSDGALAPAAPNAPPLPSSPVNQGSPPAAKLILASASPAATAGAISRPTATVSILGWPPGVPVLRPASAALPMVY